MERTHNEGTENEVGKRERSHVNSKVRARIELTTGPKRQVFHYTTSPEGRTDPVGALASAKVSVSRHNPHTPRGRSVTRYVVIVLGCSQ